MESTIFDTVVVAENEAPGMLQYVECSSDTGTSTALLDPHYCFCELNMVPFGMQMECVSNLLYFYSTLIQNSTAMCR